MSDFNIRGKLPFNVVSSSVDTGYAAALSASVKQNIAIVNHHRDDYGELEGSTLQGPFTQQHVGGNQHRHVILNPGNDSVSNRPEAYTISSSVNLIKIYGPDINGLDKPRANYTRGLVAKSPLNISNIQTTGNVAGNFEHNYQVVQAVGRSKINNLIVDGFEASGPLTTKFVTGSHQIYTLPNITGNSKSIFVERFNAPGGKEESSRGALDREGEEYAPNNSLVTRNIKVRQPFYNQLTQHAAQFNSGSLEGITIHAVNRNSINRLELNSLNNPVSSSRSDNFWIQHAIPSTDLRYAWISSSKENNTLFQYQQTNNVYNIENENNIINFVTASGFGDFIGISGAVDKGDVFTSNYTNTMYRDKRVFSHRRRTLSDFYLDLSNIAEDISGKNFTISFWANYSGTVPVGEPVDFGDTLEMFNLSGSGGELNIYYNSSIYFSADTFVNTFLINTNSTKFKDDTKKVKIWDEKWHLVTLTKDTKLNIKRIKNKNIPVETITYNLYVDGGLVNNTIAFSNSTDITKIHFFNGKSSFPGGHWASLLGDIFVWDQDLSAEQINKFYLLSRSSYSNEPKKYIEYSGDKLNTIKPLHVYSSRINLEKNEVYDESGNKNIKLVNFQVDKDYENDLNKKISYSTYFNGAYQGASWKFLKHKEHPVVKRLTTGNTNIVSVVIPETPKQINTTINGRSVTINVRAPRRQGTLLNVKEPSIIVNNKPLKHQVIFKNSLNSNNAYQIKYTHANNLEYFSNNQLNSVLGLENKQPQTYDRIYDFYTNTDIPEEENPFQKVLGYSYAETIFPTKQNISLKESRSRIDYITDESGLGYSGYDKQLGTQRTFWRDNLNNRQRTQNIYFNSFGYHIPTASYEASSIRPAEFIQTSSLRNFTSEALSYEIKTNKSGELFSYNSWVLSVVGFVSPRFSFPIDKVPEFYFYNSKNTTYTSRLIYNPYQSNIDPAKGLNRKNITSYRAKPNYIYEHSDIKYLINPTSYVDSASYDLGLNRFTEIISGKNAWYDNYELFAEDIKPHSKYYSIIPEFNISNNIKDVVKVYGGDFRKIKVKDFISDISINFKDKLERQNSKLFKQDKITLNLNVIKKLLPYNGFYPIDRSIQLINNLKDSYIDTDSVVGGILLTGAFGISASYDSIDQVYLNNAEYTFEKYAKESAFLEPFYAPGIFYNTIKSGLAVNWTVYTGSLPISGDASITSLLSKPSYKIPFESILDIFSGLPTRNNAGNEDRIVKFKDLSYLMDASDYGQNYAHFQSFFELQKKSNPLYSLSVNNFFAETINFFLKDNILNTFTSLPENQFKQMDRNKTYYMDVILRKTDNFEMINAFSSSNHLMFGNMSGRYFGPAFWTGSLGEKNNIISIAAIYETLKDPAYCIYTPPYFYGESVARLSFKPPVTRQYTLSEILSQCESNIVYINSGLNNTDYKSGSLYANYAMNVGDSLNIFGVLEDRGLTARPTGRPGTDTYRVEDISNTTNIYKWVISTKMETPVLNFINQEHVIDNSILQISEADQQLKIEDPSYVYPTSSGFGIGMWSGYGEIPKQNEGIFFELRESFPQRRNIFEPIQLSGSVKTVNSTTGSLIDVCGFQKESKRIGEVADEKVISEAIIVIPYSTAEIKRPRVTRKGGQTIAYGMTTKVEDFNLFRISQQIYNKQKLNIDSGKPAVAAGDFGSTIDIQDTSISNMIETMKNYIIPPNFNFLEYSDIKPFVMYIAEFESTLNKQDLADIWQGVMPSIATKAEFDESVISHPNNIHEFFHGVGLPENVKFLIFKVKKKAEINYYKMTAQSTDDNLFKFNFKVGKKAPEYSYNWPYDYCSLIEMAKVDIELDYGSKDETLKLEQQGINVSSSFSSNISVATRR